MNVSNTTTELTYLRLARFALIGIFLDIACGGVGFLLHYLWTSPWSTIFMDVAGLGGAVVITLSGFVLRHAQTAATRRLATWALIGLGVSVLLLIGVSALVNASAS